MNNTTSSPSTTYDFIAATNHPIVYTYSVTLPTIVITCILNMCVLCRRTLRSTSCTYYFLASTPPTLVYQVVSPLYSILLRSTSINFAGTSISCKVGNYFIYLMSFLYALMLMCASIDRFCSSSTSARLRRFSQVRVARIVIIVVWIVAFVYMAPFMAIFYYDNNSTGVNKCFQDSSTTLAAAYLMTRVILYYFVIPITMGIFGALTIYNIRNQTRRVAPVNQAHLHRRTEGQLSRMLIIQLIVYFLFFLPNGILYSLMTFVPSLNTPYYITIRNLVIVWQQGVFFASFFCYIVSGKVYREELKKMFKCNQIREQISQIGVNRTLAMRQTTVSQLGVNRTLAVRQTTVMPMVQI